MFYDKVGRNDQFSSAMAHNSFVSWKIQERTQYFDFLNKHVDLYNLTDGRDI